MIAGILTFLRLIMLAVIITALVIGLRHDLHILVVLSLIALIVNVLAWYEYLKKQWGGGR